MKVPFVDLKRQMAGIRQEIDAEISWALDNGAFVLGPQVAAFEKRFASLHDAPYCSGVNSGTSALHLALKGLEIGPGDEVVLPAMTFVATAWAVLYVGATPVFCDVCPDTATMDPDSLEEVISGKTRAVIPVHLYGQPCDMDAICEICRDRGLLLVEDCAQAHCAEFKNQRVGTFGAAGCFSFYPGKNLGACGEAGAVITRDEVLNRRINALRDHGQSARYCHETLGYNYRMEGFQGAVLGVKVGYIEEWTRLRRAAARAYRERLPGIDLIREKENRRHVYHLFVARHRQRDRVCAELNRRGVATGLHYPKIVPQQNAFAGFSFEPGQFPVSEKLAESCLSLPMFPELTPAEIDYVAAALTDIVGQEMDK